MWLTLYFLLAAIACLVGSVASLLVQRPRPLLALLLFLAFVVFSVLLAVALVSPFHLTEW